MVEKINYNFEEIESIEQIGEFENEYVYDIEMDDDTHTFIANDILVHNSLYCCYGDLFKTFTKGPVTDKEKLDWILRFNKEFLDKWNNERLGERFGSRHAKNIHEFELETVAKSGIFLAKKKYTQALVFSKGNYYLEKPKVKGKGVELIKPQTPAMARTILNDLVDVMLNKFDPEHRNHFSLLLAARMRQHLDKWMVAPVDEIAMSGNIGKYSENVYEDEGTLDVKTSAGLPTKGIARYNYMCNQRGLGGQCVYSGKIKYYYISLPKKRTEMFAYPQGECPDWAPKPSRLYQFQKCVIDPINRFCKALQIPLMNTDCSPQLDLFL